MAKKVGRRRRGERGGDGAACRCHPLVIIFSLVGLAILIAIMALVALSRNSGAIITGTHTQSVPAVNALEAAAADTGASTTAAVNSDAPAVTGITANDGTDVDHSKYRYQVTFSTDCGDYQRWQSYLVFYSAMTVKQPGYVTRIASGCTDKEEEAEKQWFEKHVKPMSSRFRLHLTPHFSKVKDETGKETGKRYDFFNKPFGMQHWMEHGEGMGVDPATGKVLNEDAIVILLDPDHILLRPLTEDFSDPAHIFRADMGQRKVSHGHPFAQEYGYGADWQRQAIGVAEEDSPAKKISSKEAADYYPAGPPYLATGRDFYTIVKKWTEYVPKVHKVYPHLLAEMYAYSLASAHEELPHQMVRTLMMSDTGMQREGWNIIDDLSLEEACQFGFDIHRTGRSLPGVFHYCQRYMIGKHFFGKRRLPKDFLTCEKSLLYEPPPDVGTKYDYKMPPPPHKPAGEKKPLNEMQQRRESLAICLITRTLNDAATLWKKNACEEGKANLNKSLDLWTLEEFHSSTG